MVRFKRLRVAKFLLATPTFARARTEYADLWHLLVSKEEILALKLFYSHCSNSVLLDSPSSMWRSLDLHYLFELLTTTYHICSGKAVGLCPPS